MEDFLINLSILEMYKSSKNTTWRQQVLDRQTAIYSFLYRNGLLLVNPLDEHGKARLDLVLMRSHLTDDGFEMFKKVIPSWEKARDRDGNVENLGILEKGLQKIRLAK